MYFKRCARQIGDLVLALLHDLVSFVQKILSRGTRVLNSVELPYLWVIAQIFRQIRVHSSIIVLFLPFEDFLLKKFLKV